MSVATIQGTVKKDYKDEVAYWKAWMAKQKILERLMVTCKKSFQNLFRMLMPIKDLNPRAIVIWDYKIVDNIKISTSSSSS
ncbi:hypothetical protein NC651_005800 [Populus alba x Populus x berolinensis]|nr:hypothetical protein NC651_005800 [Populus alba x Populus x berolinensis]